MPDGLDEPENQGMSESPVSRPRVPAWPLAVAVLVQTGHFAVQVTMAGAVAAAVALAIGRAAGRGSHRILARAEVGAGAAVVLLTVAAAVASAVSS
jgi:hypothetical protein